MKTPIAITLIVCGVIVVAIPSLWGGWNSLMLSITLTHLTQPGSANMGEIPQLYQFGCWLLGAAMIAVAVASSLLSNTEIPSSRRAVI
jgi:hypothetical protein